jgi:Sap, sulfolipid-1-addressing protein
VDSTQLQILPLALIMVMGPQILTAIFLVTSHEPVKNSGAMLVGVVLAACLSLPIWFGLYDVLNIKPSSGSGPSTADYVVAGLLALAGIHTFIGRHDASVPKWMAALQQAEPKRAFSLGFLLILLMPTDIVAVISTVHWLHDNHDNLLILPPRNQ